MNLGDWASARRRLNPLVGAATPPGQAHTPAAQQQDAAAAEATASPTSWHRRNALTSCCCACCTAPLLSSDGGTHELWTLGVVPRSNLQAYSELLYTLFFFSALILHYADLGTRFVDAQRGRDSATASASGFNMCERDNRCCIGDPEATVLLHFNTTLCNQPHQAVPTYSIVLGVLFFLGMIASTVGLFAQGNFDSALLVPAVSTVQVVMCMAFAVALPVIEVMAATPDLATVPYALTTMLQSILVLFLDTAVNVSWAFQLVHVIALLVMVFADLLVVNLWMLPEMDSVVACSNFSGTPASWTAGQLKRIILLEMLTLNFAGATNTCCLRKRTELRFANAPINRSNWQSKISEDMAPILLRDVNERWLRQSEKRRMIEKTLFNHELGTLQRVGSSGSIKFGGV